MRNRWLVLALVLFGLTTALGQQSGDEVSPEVQQLYAQARSAQQGGNATLAIEKYRAIIRVAPHIPAAYNNLGMLYFNESDYEHAAEILKRGLEINGKMPTASAMLGMCYFQLGKDDLALPLLKAAVRANAADEKAEMMLIHIQINLKIYNDAAAQLRAFLEKHPNSQEAWYLLGKTYLQLSEDALGRVHDIDPDSVIAHEISGEIDTSMHNYDLALVEFKKAVDLAPNQPGTHMHLGETYWSIGKWQSAAEEFKAELGNDPNSCMARWKLANSLLEENDDSEHLGDPLTELNLAIDRCPSLMQAHVDRARALIRLGKQPDALPDLLLAVAESPREPSIYFLLANVYRSQGKSADAQKEMALYGTLQREASAAVAQQAADANTLKSTAK